MVKFFRGKLTAAKFKGLLTMVMKGRLKGEGWRMGMMKNIVFESVTGMEKVSPSLLKEAKLNKALKWIR